MVKICHTVSVFHCRYFEYDRFNYIRRVDLMDSKFRGNGSVWRQPLLRSDQKHFGHNAQSDLTISHWGSLLGLNSNFLALLLHLTPPLRPPSLLRQSRVQRWATQGGERETCSAQKLVASEREDGFRRHKVHRYNIL